MRTLAPPETVELFLYYCIFGCLYELLLPADLVDMGVCPSCYDCKHGHCLYEDPSERMLYEDDQLECMLIGNPRAPGHAIISTKAHYKDTMDLPDDLCRDIYSLTRRAMIALKKVYGSESVYLCPMFDGSMNHFHVQMIPRYAYEKRGSRNFLKERKQYIVDSEKVMGIRQLLSSTY